MQYKSVKETAKKFNISERRVQKLCEEGRIKGAKMISNVWVIPENAQKPADNRYSAELDGLISLSDVCKDLSISVATGRNWIKLGKLIPQKTYKKTSYFSEKYISELKKSLYNDQNAMLKSRRNKNYITGNKLYNSYVSKNSINLSCVQELLKIIDDKKIQITREIIISILSDCAIQFLTSKFDNTQSGINSYLKDKPSDKPYLYMINDLMEKDIKNITAKYPELFNFKYTYEPSQDILGLLYISLNNLGNRKASGVYYTPTDVVTRLCKGLKSVKSGKTVLDPCCGTGNFILQLPSDFDYKDVYGSDIDSLSVKITRINYALKYNIYDKDIIYSHIKERDYLKNSDEIKFDYIIGNPPWGYNYSEKEKSELREEFLCATGSNIESYDVFVEQTLKNLKVNGILSFVLPEAILNVKSHTPVRKILIKNNSLQRIEILGNVFDNVQCPSIILQAVHTNKPFSSVGLEITDKNRKFVINTERFVSEKCFSFGMSDEEYNIINKISDKNSKKFLAGNSVFALGIVTGDNKKYLSDKKQKNNEMVLKGSDIYKFRFKNSNYYIDFKPEGFQQVAPTEYYRTKEKLLYRFICNQLVFAYDNNKTLSLNSGNILIPQIKNMDIKYILAILNSKTAQFYFKRQFNSVKVLRSFIEQIPIPVTDKKTQNDIIKITDLLIKENDKNKIQKLYDELDYKISKLYNLSENEYKIICKTLENDKNFLY